MDEWFRRQIGIGEETVIPNPKDPHRGESHQERVGTTLTGLPIYRHTVSCSCGWSSEPCLSSGVAWQAWDCHRIEEGVA